MFLGAKEKNRQGELIEYKIFTVEVVDHNNITRRLPASRHKVAAEGIGVQSKASDIVPCSRCELRSSNEPFYLLPPIRDKLASWGLIDHQQAASTRLLIEHVKDWKVFLEAKGNTMSHAMTSANRVCRVASDCKWNNLSDITSESFDQWRIGAKDGGLSVQSINYHLTVAKTFCKWLVKSKRLTENPLAYLSKNKVTDKDRCRIRRASEDAELEKLLAATLAGERHHGLTGWERTLYYRLAFETGFRWSECQGIIKSEFDFTSDPPTATVTSGKEKNRKTRSNPISSKLATDMKKHMILFLPNARVFPSMPKRRVGSEMIQLDLAAAGISYRDEFGQARDFHSLRKTFGTRLARHNVPLVVAQKLIDHSTPDLTANYYTMIMPEDRAVAVSRLPTLTGKNALNTDVLSKTETIGMESFSLS